MRHVAFVLLVLAACKKDEPSKPAPAPAPAPSPSSDAGVGLRCNTQQPESSVTSDCEQLCTAGNGAACAAAGWRLVTRPGDTNVADAKRSLELALQGCQLGAYQGCQLAGSLYQGWRGPELGDKAKAAELDRKAFALYEAACDKANDITACDQVAWWLKKDLAEGDRSPERVKTYEDKAHALATAACDRGDAYACYWQAIDPKRPEAEQNAFMLRACSAGHAMACSNAALQRDITPERMLELTTRACQLGYEPACKVP